MHETPVTTDRSSTPAAAGASKPLESSTPFLPAAATLAAFAAATVTAHRTCIGCGYDVVGLPVDGVCPECGKAVAITRARPLIRDLGDAGLTLHLGVKGMMLAAWIIVASGPAVFVVGQFALAIFGLGLLVYLLSWGWLLRGFVIASRHDRRINQLVTPTMCWVMMVSLIIALGSAAAATAVTMTNNNSERLVFAVLLLTSLSSAVHFLGLPIALNALRSMVDGRSSAAARWAYNAFTLILHGICLLWSVAVELVMLSSSSGSASNSLEFAASYLFTLPVHAAWILVTAIVFTRLSFLMARETRLIAPGQRDLVA